MPPSSSQWRSASSRMPLTQRLGSAVSATVTTSTAAAAQCVDQNARTSHGPAQSSSSASSNRAIAIRMRPTLAGPRGALCAIALDLRGRRCSVGRVLGSDITAIAASAGSTLGVVAQLELVAVGGVLLVLAGLLLAREVRRWRRSHPPDSEEVRARAVMGELCPNGWHAQITLYGP